MGHRVRFTKAHGAHNDFVIVEDSDAHRAGLSSEDMPRFSIAICDRHSGVGADGLELVTRMAGQEAFARLSLRNADGSSAEISGNGTRCVAAYLSAYHDAPQRFWIETEAGVREVVRTTRQEYTYSFRMRADEDSCRIVEPAAEFESIGMRLTASIVDVGNPQCVCWVDSHAFDWEAVGADIERRPSFPKGTNVSFVTVGESVDEATALDVRFWERGAGATMSSGTGSLGAAVAARHRGLVRDRARVQTEGGDMWVDWEDGIGLTGPACLVSRGEFMLDALP